MEKRERAFFFPPPQTQSLSAEASSGVSNTLDVLMLRVARNGTEGPCLPSATPGSQAVPESSFRLVFPLAL